MEKDEAAEFLNDPAPPQYTPEELKELIRLANKLDPDPEVNESVVAIRKIISQIKSPQVIEELEDLIRKLEAVDPDEEKLNSFEELRAIEDELDDTHPQEPPC